MYTAFELERHGIDYCLLEARDRLGGRILSHRVEPSRPGAPGFDLGPAWFWPGQQHMAELVQQLGLEGSVFEQYAEGLELIETADGTLQAGHFGASMAGSYRLRGGIGEIVQALAARIPERRIQSAAPVTGLELTDDAGVRTRAKTADGQSVWHSRFVVLALPPRLGAHALEMKPALPERRRAELGSIATWMAGQGKVLALYSEPFWRRKNLSGDAFSYVGPLSEIHDASASSGEPYALFGFLGIPPETRSTHREALKSAAVDQLRRLFGPQAGEPLQALIKDWAFDPWTATAEDLVGPAEHSLVGLDQVAETSWHGRLLWSGSETATPGTRSNGYLEGALEAGRRTVARLLSELR